ncbi:TIGR02117 family protein [Sphingomonas bacterium]|uniref:TIGR02117 family protein n=1 Tax=Sphingomonas bacterium TaxID=1895847 RepID=UPI0015760166|nr:TIGR02117 family protein [Sphingomonas bacterium]
MRNARPLALVAVPVSVLALAVLGYGVAALVGGSIPTNAGWRPPARGVTIWVESGPIHTGLVLPKVAAGVDWRGFAPPGDFGDPRAAGFGYLAIGWGEHGFFLGTPTWRELRPGTVLRAVAGSDETLLHVEHVARPVAGEDERPVTLTPAQYRRLAAFIVSSRRPGGRRWRGYGPADVFYEARGRYGLGHTCNSWTSDALRTAGVRVGWWTPLPVTVSGWFGVTG